MTKYRREPISRGWMIAGLVVVAVVAVALVIAAVLRNHAAAASGAAAPLPSFTDASPSATPTATPTPTHTPIDRAAERFFAVAPDALWRATAGECGKTEPVVERSTDRGQTWTDVTPHYRDIAQVASLDQIAERAAAMVTELGDDCTPTGIRTFTDGRFWEPFDAVIDDAHYLSFTDAAKVVSPGGDYAAPCNDAHGLRAAGDIEALICDGTAYERSADKWMPLPQKNALAVAVFSGDLYVASAGEKDCAGIAITRFTDAEPDRSESAGCAADATAKGSIAIGPSSLGTFVWSADTVILVKP